MSAGDRVALGVSNCRPAAHVVSAILRAERLGAVSAFIAEDVNCRDAFALGALAAAQTDRIRIGTGVANPYTRAPNSLAMAVATLDEVSGGRAFLGLGASAPGLIRDQLGLTYDSPSVRLQETATAVRGLLSGTVFDFEGSLVRVRGTRVEVPTVQDRIPLVFAAMGPKTLRLAGRLADGVLLNVGASVEYVRWAVERIREGASEAGRDPREIEVAAWLSVYLTDDPEDVLPKTRAWLARMLSIPRQGELLLRHAGIDPEVLPSIRERVSAYPHSGDSEAAGGYVPVEAVMRMALVGDESTVAARLGEYRAAGVTLPVMAISALEQLYGD